ncbi:MAG: hypothetical protein JXB10_01905, partial [Pirellulales bacterium]|nr:hypothetical protein [Pirellulales bacterium]
LMSQSLLALPVQVTTAAGAFDAHKNIMKKISSQSLTFVFLRSSDTVMKHLKKKKKARYKQATQKASASLLRRGFAADAGARAARPPFSTVLPPSSENEVNRNEGWKLGMKISHAKHLSFGGNCENLVLKCRRFS